MNIPQTIIRTRAQESSNAIERLYITMRHLFNRGFYKPMGVSGTTLREALLFLQPEIYGAIAEETTELNGLKYVLDRLPSGIEECRYITLTSDEGYANAHFKPVIPLKRRRNCYRIDADQMNIEITRGRSEIYDILTHLTFLFIESDKIRKRVVIDSTGAVTHDWKKIEAAVLSAKKLSVSEIETVLTHVANCIGVTFLTAVEEHEKYTSKEDPNRFIKMIYRLGKSAIEEYVTKQKRSVSFTPMLRERIGHHIHGEFWANTIKKTIQAQGLLEKPVHVISANMHSVMNTLFAPIALPGALKNQSIFELYESLSKPENSHLQDKVFATAKANGMHYIKDNSGTNIDVQIFDTSKINPNNTAVLIVMDYAFGEQAYETIDELLKPYKYNNTEMQLNVESLSIMGKAGILEGKKGDVMIPTAHIFEGTADNYPFKNELSEIDFKNEGVSVVSGTMITVLGTSLQNKDILKFFNESTWNVIGLEMEGAHYQKAIQAASKIRKTISEKVKVRYAYYASDNPLETGSTLASGGLGATGIKPTYTITEKILNQIIN